MDSYEYMYNSVYEFNYVFGVLERDKSLSSKEIEVMSLNLVWEELMETFCAKNEIEEIDGIADSLYVAFGMLIRLYSQDGDFKKFENTYRINNIEYTYNLVHGIKSNYNKLRLLLKTFFKIEESADETVFYILYFIRTLISYSEEKGLLWQEAFRLVHENNMTKFYSSKEEVEKKILADPTLSYEQRGKYFIVFNTETKKIVKPEHFVPVDLSSLVKK